MFADYFFLHCVNRLYSCIECAKGVLLHVSYRKLCGFRLSKFFTSNTAANSNTQPHNCHCCHPVCLQFICSIFLQQAERGVRSSLPGRRRLEDVGKVSRRISGRNRSYRWGENCTFISTSRLRKQYEGTIDHLQQLSGCSILAKNECVMR